MIYTTRATGRIAHTQQHGAGRKRGQWNLRHRIQASLVMLATLGMLLSPAAQAANYYWNTTTTGTWATGANWSDDPTTAGNTGTVPGSGDTAIFNQSSVTGDAIIQLDASASIAGLVFDNTGATAIQGLNASQALTIGASGITLDPNAGAVAIGGGTGAAITLGAAQSWINNSGIAGSTLTVSNNVTNGGNLLTVGGTNGTIISGIVSGAGGITLANTAALTLSGANTYSGNTTLASGATLNFNNTKSIGTGTLIISGGTLDNTSGAAITNANNNVQQWNGNFAFTGGTGTTHDLNLGTGAVTLNASRIVTVNAGTLTVGGAISGSGFSITKAGAGTLALGGVIGTGAGGISVTGGTLALTGQTNTYTGNITVDGATSVLSMVGLSGTTAYTTTNPLGTAVAGGANYKTLTLQNGGTFKLASLNFNDNVISSTNVGAGVVFIIGSGGGTLEVASGSTLILDDGNTGVTGTGTTAQQLQGTGDLKKTGVGTLVLRQQYNYAGAIDITAGTLQATGAAGVFGASGGTNGNTTIRSGAAFDANGNAITDGDTLTINGTGLASSPKGAIVNNHGTNNASLVTPIVLGSGATIGTGAKDLTLNAAATVNTNGNTLTTFNSGAGNLGISSVISGTGDVKVTGNSTGFYVPSGANTYTGGTTLSSGSFTAVAVSSVGAAGNPTSGPFGAGAAPLVLAGGQIRNSSGAAASTVGNVVTISADTTFPTATTEKSLTFSGPVTLSGATRTLNSGVGTTVAGTSIIFTGAIGDGGNGLGLIKTGAGNITLAGANTYTGSTTVNGGSLIIAPTGSLTSAIDVGSAGTGGTLNFQGSNTYDATNPITIVGNATAANAGTLSLTDSAFNTVTLNTTTPATPVLVLGSAAGAAANLTFEVGTLGGDQIALGSGAQLAVNPGGALLTVNAAGYYAGQSRVLISSSATDLTTLTGINLATTSGNWGGNVLSMNVTSNAVTVSGTANPIPATAWFKGNIDANWNTFTGGAANNSNFTTDAAGTTDAHAMVTGATDLHFYAANATTANLATSLGQNVTIKTLTIDATASLANPISIASGNGAYALTITPTSSSTGITYQAGSAAGATLTISAPVVLGASQTWTNNALAPINVSGNISGTADLILSHASAGAAITLSGAINITGSITRDSSNAAANDVISGVIGSTVTGITQNNPNTSSALQITSANPNYAGPITINAGTVLAQPATATNAMTTLGTGTMNLNGGALSLKNNGTASNQLIVTGNGTTGNNLNVSANSTINVDRNSANSGSAYVFNNLTTNSQLTVTGANGYSALVNGTTSITGPATLNSSSASLVLMGKVSNAGNNFTVSGASTTRLLNVASGANANSLTGTITINGGNLTGYAPAADSAVAGLTNSLGTAAISFSGTNPVLRLAPNLTGGLNTAPTAGLLDKSYTGISSNAATNYMGNTSPITTGTAGQNPTGSQIVGNINIPTAATATTSSHQYTGLLNITTAGMYSLKIDTDDNGSLYVDGVITPSVSNGNATSFNYLSAGLHTFSTRWNNNGGNGRAVISYQGPDTANSMVVIPATAFSNVGSTALLATNFGNNVSIAAGTNATIETASNTTMGSLSTTGTGTGTTLNLVGTNDLTTMSFTGGTLATDLALVMPTVNLAIGGLSGPGGLAKSGFGSLDLGVNTYAGATSIAGGVATFAGSSSLGNGSATNTLALNGTTLRLTGSNNSVNLGVNRSVVLSNTATIDVPASNSLEFSGAISGTGNLTKTSGGTLTLSGANSYTGQTSVNNGTLILTGASAASATTKLLVGFGAGAAGAVIQKSGTNITINNALSGQDVLSLGGGGGYGYYLNNGGTLSTGQLAPGGNSAGAGTTGVFEQRGGSTTVSSQVAGGWVVFGWQGTNSNGVLNVFDGNVTNGSSGNDTRMGFAASVGSMGMLNVIGANASYTHTASSTKSFIDLAANTGNFGGYLNINNGGLVTTNLVKASNAGTPSYFGFNGGTLKAASNTTSPNNFIMGITATTIYSGGATIDTNGFNVTASQALLAPTGQGVATIPVTDGGSGYIGAPAVRISGGGGTGASAIANVDLDPLSPTFGKVTSITITSAGNGYTSAPTIALIGGGATTAATLDNATLATNNTTGGLTKNGAGTLTLTGVNTYAGNTIINAGVLSFGNTAAQTITGNFSGAGALSQTGTGTTTLLGNINLGQIIGTAGTIAITGATNINSTPVLLNGGIFDLGGTTQNGGNFTITSGSIVNGTLSTTNFLKQGPGTITLSNTNAVSSVTINQGLAGITSNPATLSNVNLNFAATGAPASNLFSPTANLTLGGSANNLLAGGQLTLTGANSASNSQTFNSTLVSGGASAISLTAGTGGSVALNLGTLTRTVKGTLDITLPTGTQSSTNGVIISNPGAAGTLLTSAAGTAYGTIAGNDWAANSTDSTGNIVGLSVAGAGGTSLYTAYATDPGALTGHADITGTITAPSDQTFDSLRFNVTSGTTGHTLTLAGTNTINSGGILFTSNSNGGTITGGTIVPGAGQELVIIANKANVQNYVLGSVIADGTSGATTVTYRGMVNGGTTGSIITVAANNTYTGPTYITRGRVQVIAAGVTTPFGTGANAVVYVDGNSDGQFFTNQNVTLANPFVVVGDGFNENGTRRGAIRLDSTSTNTPTLTGNVTLLGNTTIGNNSANTGAGVSVISGNILTSSALGASSFALNKVGTGVIRLGGTNNQTATNIAAGVLNITSDAALGLTTAPLTYTGNSTLQLNSALNLSATRSLVVNSGVIGSFDTQAFTTTLPNIVTGTGTFAKTGTGTMNLNVPFTFGGTFAIDQGTVSIGVDQTLTSPLTFGSATGVTSVGSLDLTNANLTIPSLLVQNANATGNTITVGTGKTLTINGNVQLGATTPNNAQTSKLTITGTGGSLNMQSVGGVFMVGGSTVGSAGTNSLNSILDTSGISAVTVNVGSTGTVRVNQPTGINISGNQSSWLLPTPAAATAATPVTTITAGNFNIGDNGGNGNGAGQTNAVTLGTGLTTLNVNTLNVGTGGRDLGQITFAAGNGTLKLRAADGASRTAVNLGTGTANTGVAPGTGVTNNIDFTGHSVDLLVSTLAIGAQNRNTNRTDTFTFDTGTLDVTTVAVGANNGTANTTGASNTWTSSLNIGGGTTTVGTGGIDIANGSTAVTGTDVIAGNVNISGGNVSVANSTTLGAAIRLSHNTVATGLTANGALNLTGGTLTVAGDIIKGSSTGAGTATVNISGGTLDMGGKNIGSATSQVGTITLASGALRNVNQINGGATTLNKTGTGSLLLAGTNTFSNHLNVTQGTVQLGSTTALGSGQTFNATVVSGTNVASGAVVDLNGNANISEAITLSGTGIAGAGALINSSVTPASISNGLASVGLTTPTGASTSTISITGGNPTTPATATVDLRLTSNTFTLATGGAGYSAVATATIAGGTPTTAGTVTSLMGVTAASFTLNANSGYTVVPTITFNTPTGGTAATGHFVNTGGVLSLVIDTPGAGYTAAPTATVTGGTTSGTAVTVTPAFNNLIVSAISVTNAGVGYTSVPTGLTFSGTATTQATATVNANSLGVNSVTITNPGAGFTSAPTISVGGTAVLTAGMSGIVLAGDSSIGGVGDITVSGIVSESGGARSLTKVGTNKLTLASANSYSGGTTLSAGTLVAANTTGSALGSGNLTLDGGTFASGVVGSIAGNVNAGSGAHTIAPGGIGSIGALTVGGLTLNANSALNFDITNNTTLDALTTGALAAAGLVNIQVPTGLAANTYKLIGYGSTALTDATSFTLNGGSIPAGYSLNLNTSTKELDLIVASVGPINLTWAGGTGGWSSGGAGWLNGVNPANWADANNAIIGAGTDTAGTITVTGTVKPTAMTFNAASTGNYTVTGGTIDMNATTMTITANTAATINSTIANGSLTKAGTAALTLTGTHTYSGPTSVSSGTLQVGTPTTAGSIAASSGVTVASSASFVAGSNTTLKSLNLSASNANASILAGALRILTVGDGTSDTGLLDLSGSGSKLDLNSGAVVLNFNSAGVGTSLRDTIKNLIGTGKIMSSRAVAANLADPNTPVGIGYALGDYTAVGLPSDATSIVARYTLVGDANLDGVVDVGDLGTALAPNYGSPSGNYWQSGDFNGDGAVDTSDLALLAANYGKTLTLPGDAIGNLNLNFEQDLAQAFASVPEPGTLSLLGLAALALLKRRNRSSRKAA